MVACEFHSCFAIYKYVAWQTEIVTILMCRAFYNMIWEYPNLTLFVLIWEYPNLILFVLWIFSIIIGICFLSFMLLTFWISDWSLGSNLFKCPGSNSGLQMEVNASCSSTRLGALVGLVVGFSTKVPGLLPA